MTRKQPKPKRVTPKPVEAWGVAGPEGLRYLAFWQDEEVARMWCKNNAEEVPIRVRIVPIVKRKTRTKRKERKK